MSEQFSRNEKELIVKQMLALGLTEIANDFKENGIPRIFNTSNGKMENLKKFDYSNIKYVKSIFDSSRTYLIIRAHDDVRENIGTVDYFIGLDSCTDDFKNTDFISATPEHGAIQAPAYYAGYDCKFSIECFMYSSKLPDEEGWHILTSIQDNTCRSPFDDDDLPF